MSIKISQIHFIWFQMNPSLSECIPDLNLHDWQGGAAPEQLYFSYPRAGKREKMINSVTKYSRFPLKTLRRELPSEGRSKGGKAQWLELRYNGLSLEPHLRFAFLSVKLEHKKIDDYQKVILHNVVYQNLSLSINCRLVSINKTHDIALLLFSMNNHGLTKQHRIQELKVINISYCSSVCNQLVTGDWRV